MPAQTPEKPALQWWQVLGAIVLAPIWIPALLITAAGSTRGYPSVYCTTTSRGSRTTTHCY